MLGVDSMGMHLEELQQTVFMSNSTALIPN
jgi:hypothetical protein